MALPLAAAGLLGGISAAGNLISDIGNFHANKYLQNDAQAFNAMQADIQRTFEKMMSDTAYQRAVSDMEAAGLNPAAMFGTSSGGAASTPAAAAATSTNASIHSSSLGDSLTRALEQALSDDRTNSHELMIEMLRNSARNSARNSNRSKSEKTPASKEDEWGGFEVA